MKKLILLLPLLTMVSAITASPWIETGNMKLRHQLQLLADEGIINTPVTTWPISVENIANQLENHKKNSSNNNLIRDDVQQALSDINQYLNKKKNSISIETTLSSKKMLIRDFSAVGKETASVKINLEKHTNLFDARISVSKTKKGDHPSDQSIRLDESYLSHRTGNWIFSVGKQSRWWGPGYDGSLIYGNNSRPITGISLDRASAKPFKNSLLKWMGPWQLNMVFGTLESDRHIPDAKVLSTRLTFKPTSDFEVGLSRTMQVGGKGRSLSLKVLFDSFIGKDNYYADTPGTEPGNQLAGIDWRWASPLGKNKKYATYGQIMGEDEAHYLPSKIITLLGVETWGQTKLFNGSSWRGYVEFSDTSTAWYDNDKARNNTAYNHHIYRDGLRFLGASLGHGIDSDSRLISIGGLLSTKNGDFYHAWLKSAQINEDGVGKNTLSPEGMKWVALGASYKKNINKNTKIQTSAWLADINENGKENKKDIGLSISYTKSF